jgi:hypothetical protein
MIWPFLIRRAFFCPSCPKEFEVAPFYKMKKILILFTFISLNSWAEPNRKPAVLDTSCNFDIPTSTTEIIDGLEVIKEKPVEVVSKELCKAVRDCMGSAPDERMAELKGREEAACSNKITAVTTRAPAVEADPNFDGNRNAKPILDEKDQTLIKKPSEAVKK